MKWHANQIDATQIVIDLQNVEKSDAAPEVRVSRRNGEVLTLNASSLLYPQSLAPEDYVALATLGTAGLTALLLSWRVNGLRSIVGQPKILLNFLMTCDLISVAWIDLEDDVLGGIEPRRRNQWSRNR